jgi:serine-type D-Ala-D-Ala carboxypeptidase (penicillin-binding protein 5/6)
VTALRRSPPALLAVLALALAAPGARAATPPAGLDRPAAAIIADASDGHVLASKHPDERRAIASTTKLMTALLTLERARPAEVFTAPAYNALPGESRINLRRGERMTVHDLLNALLLPSANDAAVTLARGIGGSVPRFVAEMNGRATRLGLTETHYANPIGLDSPGNYSSARDLSGLAAYLMRDRRFARIVARPSALLRSGDRRRLVRNRNDLVARYPWVDGVKTGYTPVAGNVLVAAARGAGGAAVISVVMGERTEAARDSDSLALLRFGLSRFRLVRALDRRRPVARPKVRYRSERAELVPAHGLTVALRRGQRLRRRGDAPDRVKGPLAAGTRVGWVTVLRDGRPVARVPLVTARAVPGAGTLRVLASVLRVPLTLAVALGILVAVVLTARRSRLPGARRGRGRTRSR